MGNKTVVVIGAVNMDICGRPDKAPRLHDSNPGTVSFSAGGVGRNIAHNLCLLGMNVKFIAAIGDDVYGDSVYQAARPEQGSSPFPRGTRRFRILSRRCAVPHGSSC